jgi:hypothetical protein
MSLSVDEMWVVNASPLIALDSIGKLDFLGRLGTTSPFPRQFSERSIAFTGKFHDSWPRAR